MIPWKSAKWDLLLAEIIIRKLGTLLMILLFEIMHMTSSLKLGIFRLLKLLSLQKHANGAKLAVSFGWLNKVHCWLKLIRATLVHPSHYVHDFHGILFLFVYSSVLSRIYTADQWVKLLWSNLWWGSICYK